MPTRGKSGGTEPRGANQYASATGFQALKVDQLPSDTEDAPEPVSEPATPRTRATSKRAAKTKATHALETQSPKKGKSNVKIEDPDSVLTKRAPRAAEAPASEKAPAAAAK